MSSQQINIFLIITMCSVIIFTVIVCLIRRFTEKITSPIKQLTTFTQTLTTSTDFKEKQKHIANMKKDEFFHDIRDPEPEEKLLSIGLEESGIKANLLP